VYLIHCDILLTQLQVTGKINATSDNVNGTTMLFSLSRVKPAIRNGMSYLNNHRRLLLLIFLILPFFSYLFVWTLSTTETFFPRPLRQAKEVLIVVAHPDDECVSPFKFILTHSSVLCADYSADITEWSGKREYARIISGYQIDSAKANVRE
jgi:hypothetical protein